MVAILLLVLGCTAGVKTRAAAGGTVNEDMLRPGDILLVDVYTGWSQFGLWDHAAAYVGIQPGLLPYAAPVVIEATFDKGVHCTALADFLARDAPAAVAALRLRDSSGGTRAAGDVVGYTIAQVGKPFDYTATAALPCKLNAENTHCTELIWRAFKAIGIDVDSNGGPFVYPDDIFHSRHLEQI